MIGLLAVRGGAFGEDGMQLADELILVGVCIQDVAAFDELLQDLG